jgi:hypothetical protein
VPSPNIPLTKIIRPHCPRISTTTNMGLKRKASFSLSPPSSASAISPSRDQSSPFQPLRAPDNHPYSVTNAWSIAEPCSSPAVMLSDTAPSYFNSRTRKRFRDSRPDEETIHQNTLNKLFSAQRQHQSNSEAGPSTNGHAFGHDREASESSLSSAHFRLESCASLISGPTQLKQHEKSKSQRSLDGFFSASGSRKTSQSSLADSNTTFSPPAPPLWNATYTPANSALEPASILTCEDCYAPLLTANSRNAVDVEMMDVEGPMIESEIDDGWECELCRKRVCDTCAVRRESRVCLECANPGHGRYDALEIGEKRWVGGIGWM